MIEVLEPLTRIAGVRCALLISTDGVPVIARGKLSREGGFDGALDSSADALSGLATSWLMGISASVAPLSWDAPRRVALRSSRGTLVLCSVTDVTLLALLDTGASPEELRLPMEAAIARLRRIVRGARSSPTPEIAPPVNAAPAPRPNAPPAAPLPHVPSTVHAHVKGPAVVRADTSSKQSPREFPG